MSRLSPDQKIIAKRAELISRTAEIFSTSAVDAEHLLRMSRNQSVRLNPLTAECNETLRTMQRLGWEGTAYDWMPTGYSIDTGGQALRESDLITRGSIYIQNPASWLPVLALGPKPGEQVLDVCAAPGGKTSHIAAMTNNQAILTANDNSRPRLMKLQANCRRLGAQVDQFSLYDARSIARKLPHDHYDKILIDAPCSGDSLLRFDLNKDFTTWSIAQIKRLQQLQKRIISQSWQLLKPGGVLVYSTCTMAPEENEAVIDYAVRNLEQISLKEATIRVANRFPCLESWRGKTYSPEVSCCMRLQPSPTIGAFFIAKLVKQA